MSETSNPDPADDYVGRVYAELKGIAQRMMARERAGHTLQPTALLNEAYLRLHGSSAAGFRDRGHFLGAAAECMRRILVDHARARQAESRNAGQRPVTFHDLAVDSPAPSLDVVALDQALSALEDAYPDMARVCKLRYFADLTLEETAEALDISLATVKRHWSFARAWLLDWMKRAEP